MKTKFNLHCGQLNREGYENLDNRIDPTKSYKLDLDGTLEEILVNVGCLESIPRQELRVHIDSWFKALIPKGTLKVHFNDLYVMANKLAYNKLNILDFENEIIMQKQQSLHDMQTVMGYLVAIGFKIDTANYHDRIGIIHGIKE